MKKSKNIPLTPLESALQTQFKLNELNVQAIVKQAYDSSSSSQADSVIKMISFGLIATTARAFVGHGDFGEWLSNAGVGSPRNAYRYIKCAELFIRKLETAQFQTDFISLRLCEWANTAGIATDDLDSILKDARLTNSALEFITQDMPFSTFLNLLKTANANALSLEISEKNPQPSKQIPQQANFFDVLFDEVRATVEVKREDPQFLKMSKDELAEIGNYLLKQGREILEIAKNK
ncbi:MAG: hypothetical protein IJF70_06780 [Opitutales bacterium]|nr:hypothetical protein [Opitutales bacterium]